MKFATILPLAALSTAFVLPPEQVLKELKVEEHHQQDKASKWYDEVIATKDDIVEDVQAVKDGVLEDFEETKDDLFHRFQAFKDGFLSGVETTKNDLSHKAKSTKDDLSHKYESIMDDVLDEVDSTKDDVARKAKSTKDDLSHDYESTKDDLIHKAKSIKNDLSHKYESAKDDVLNEVDSTKDDAARKAKSTKDDLSHKYESTKDDLSHKYDSSKDSAWNDFESAKGELSHEFDSAKNQLSHEFESTQDKISHEFESTKDTLSNEYESGKDGLLRDAESAKDDLLSSFEQYFQRAKHTTEDVWSDVSKSTKNLKENAQEAWSDVSKSSGDLMNEAFSRAESAYNRADSAVHETANEMQSWFHDNVVETLNDHHHEPNQTVYQLIAASNYTKTLAKLVSDYPDLVEALNSTKANYTVFAPTDSAFEKIPDHAPKPSKEQLHAILSYHVLPEIYTAKDVLYTHTAPTLLNGTHLSSKPEPQRVAFKFTLRGLTVNFYSRIIAVNIMGTNGVIHGVDSIILPPPKTLTLIDLFPTEFSTLELGLGKTDLLDKLNTTHHAGGTFFAPSNFAFQKLGPRVNAFLFSKYGEKYLKALLEYHVVPDNTLYSDAYYKADTGKKEDVSEETAGGYFHVDLPTLLKDRNLSIDIARYGGFISIKINGFSSVSVQDGVAEDGVLHVVSSVLIPPKQVGGGEEELYQGGEISVEELKQRLQPFVVKQDL